MDNGVFDRLARQVAATPSRRSVVGKSLAAVGAVLAAGGQASFDAEAKTNTKSRKKKKGKAPRCTQLAESCSTTAECCSASICSQNGAATPDRPKCCRGIGQGCLIKEHCCGRDVDCRGDKCVYIR